MLNKNFKRDWKVSGGEVNVLETKHFSLSIDKDYFISFAISCSFTYRLVYVTFLCFVFRFY